MQQSSNQQQPEFSLAAFEKVLSGCGMREAMLHTKIEKLAAENIELKKLLEGKGVEIK